MYQAIGIVTFFLKKQFSNWQASLFNNWEKSLLWLSGKPLKITYLNRPTTEIHDIWSFIYSDYTVLVAARLDKTNETNNIRHLKKIFIEICQRNCKDNLVKENF